MSIINCSKACEHYFMRHVNCIRDSSGKPTARNERGLGTDSPTPKGECPKEITSYSQLLFDKKARGDHLNNYHLIKA
jgi:hypothetical protein